MESLKEASKEVKKRMQQRLGNEEQWYNLDDEDQILENLNSITELIENAPQNNINLCRMGGMTPILELICAHESDEVRKAACRIFNLMTANNKKIQEFATKNGAVNLAVQLEMETKPEMREMIVSSLSAFLKEDNFPGKRQYIYYLDGIQQLVNWISPKFQEKLGKGD